MTRVHISVDSAPGGEQADLATASLRVLSRNSELTYEVKPLETTIRGETRAALTAARQIEQAVTDGGAGDSVLMIQFSEDA